MFIKHPQTKFHAYTMRESQVIMSKKSQNFSLGQKFIVGSIAQFFHLHRYFIETTTDIDMLLKVSLRFCKNNELVAICVVIILFCPLLDTCISCRIGVVRQETWSYSTWFGKCSIHYAYIVFQLYDVVRFGSTVVINVLINISSLKLNNLCFQISKHEVHEYASGLTSTPMAELFCRCKRRKFIGQSKVKIVNYKILSF